MVCYHLIEIKKSDRPDKKMMATFASCGNSAKHKTTHFGASNYSDYTQHHDEERKQRYLNRHTKNENWDDPTTAGSLSRWVLWNKPTLQASIADYKKRFGF